MIDYFYRYTSEADALADAFSVAQKFQVNGFWLRDHVLPNVQVWRPSQDVTSSGVVTHTYLSGWYAIVSIDSQVPALLNSAALAFALNRDGPPYVIKNNIGAIVSDVACSPIFAGSHYPVGGYSS